MPLGSTTYHFASREDLLIAAMRRTGAEWLAGIERWERGIDPARPLADEVLRLVEESLDGERARVRVEYDLYLAALRGPALRPLAAECLDGLVALLRRRTSDDATARALAALLDGLLLQLLLTGREIDRPQLRATLGVVLDERQPPGKAVEDEPS